MNEEKIDINTLQFAAYNPREISEHDFKKLVQSIERFGDLGGIVRNTATGNLVGGHQRVRAFKALPNAEITITERFTEPTKNGTVAYGYVAFGGERFTYREVQWELGFEQAANIAANRIQGQFDLDLLAKLNYEILELSNGQDLMDLTGQTKREIDDLLNSVGGLGDTEVPGNLNDRFGVPPFSVLDTRQGYWQDRKRVWNKLIGDNAETREHAQAFDRKNSPDYMAEAMDGAGGGVSILDAVLAELVVKWFGLPGGMAFDPFAGDSIFGYVAAHSGMEFTGIELRKAQAEINQKRVDDAKLPAKYINDDALNMDNHIANESIDLAFSCPPYADLEQYSDLPNDLSNMSHEDFFKFYSVALTKLYPKLKPNRFAVITISEVRNKDGIYIGLVPQTIDIMTKAGFKFYNEMILVNSVGTLRLRVSRGMKTRKVGRTHQNVLVFFKGDPKKIKEDFVELTDIEDWIKNNNEPTDV